MYHIRHKMAKFEGSSCFTSKVRAFFWKVPTAIFINPSKVVLFIDRTTLMWFIHTFFDKRFLVHTLKNIEKKFKCDDVFGDPEGKAKLMSNFTLLYNSNIFTIRKDQLALRVFFLSALVVSNRCSTYLSNFTFLRLQLFF